MDYLGAVLKVVEPDGSRNKESAVVLLHTQRVE